MNVQSRPFSLEDFAAVTHFLESTFRINRNLHNWSVRHWEGNRYHRRNLDDFLTNPIQIWEKAGHIYGIVHSEYRGNALIQIHPDYRRLEVEMLDWAEKNLAEKTESGKKLEFWVFENDLFRQNLLQQAGYEQTSIHMNQRKREMYLTLPQVILNEAYTIRGMQANLADCQAMAALLNAAFGRDFHSAEEYANFQTAPHYRPEFDLVAIAPDGSIAANAQVTLVATCHYAEFEPVCTHPKHQRKGLARALMAQGIRMLYDAGISWAFVDAAGDNPASNALYQQMGFTEVHANYLWQKTWK